MLEGAGGSVIIVVVVVPVAAVGIGTALGIEGGGDRRCRRIEAFDHVLDNGVVADTQAVTKKLGRQVAIAEVPGDAEEPGGSLRGDLAQRLGRGIDGDHAAVLEHQSVAIPERHRLGEIEKEFQTVGCGHRHAPAVPLIVVEHDTVGGFLRPLPGGVNAGSADHWLAIWLIASSRDTTSRALRQTAKAMHGILFDKDGTLLDFEATWDPVFQRLALEAACGDKAGALQLLVAGGYSPETGRYRPGSVLAAGASDAVVALLYPGLGAEAQTERIAHIDRAFHDHGSAHSVEIEGAVEILAELVGLGYVMGVATHDSTAASKAGLAALGMADYLPHIFGYDAVANRKPAPDLVHLFCGATGLSPVDVAVVGDNVHDLVMARSAGAVAIGVTSGNSAAADLSPFADAVLASICDLPGWLHQNRK